MVLSVMERHVAREGPRPQPLRLWLAWTAASTTGLLVGALLVRPLLIWRGGSDLPWVETFAPLLFAIPGATLGLAQAYVMPAWMLGGKHHFLWWTVATAAGWPAGLLAMAALVFGPTNAEFFVGCAALGGVLGFAQSLVVRPFLRRSLAWILSSSAAVTLALLVFMVVTRGGDVRFFPGVAAAGVVYGAASGAALTFWARAVSSPTSAFGARSS
jgi:hypothetical protein